ncbi:hypothetical protein BpHYR1_036164 [Brachionus plicatilis]|uniref:RNA-directed DNA polymerase from mobile element jockey-like n=1 Tax=Brachionus plicatilis TaxID=10195 RepID=A0A3M7STH9_BRAPC|nr:hypothetical protein BpHYR1_036164 [Brachionus plicatilis]
MKISVEKSCSVVFSRYKKESDNLNLKIYGNRKINFNILILSNKKWGLNQNTLGNLYKSLVGSILDYCCGFIHNFTKSVMFTSHSRK